MNYRKILLAASIVIGAQNASAAEGIVLTVDGKTTGGETFDYSLTDLEAMGMVSILTDTPWHDRPVEFTGISLAALMEQVGAEGEVAFITALNDYAVEVPIADFAEFGVILAMKADGELMPVEDKGPLFVVYPFDDVPELDAEQYYMRAVWQVKSITIE